MSAGSEIATEVAAALKEAGEATGAGEMICTIKRPARTGGQTPWEAEAAGEGAPSYFEVTAIEGRRTIMDRAGSAVSRTDRVLMTDATSGEVLKSDRVAVGVRQADVDADTAFEEIIDVETVAPGGVALMYKVTLAD